MGKTKMGRRVDAAELADLGFPPDLIQEAVLREKASLLDIQPPADLVETTVQACSMLFTSSDIMRRGNRSNEVNYFSIVRRLWPAARFGDLSLAFQAATAVIQCQTLGGEWPRRVAGSLRFALAERQSPIVVLENHNLLSPLWWEDEDFQKINNAISRVNAFVSCNGIERSIRMVILRPAVSQYTAEELEAIRFLMRESTSDIWWVSMAKAAQYSQQDIMIIGNEKVGMLLEKPDSPPGALRSVHYFENIELACKLRDEIANKLRGVATPIKIDGQLQPAITETTHGHEGFKIAIRKVIENDPSSYNAFPK